MKTRIPGAGFNTKICKLDAWRSWLAVSGMLVTGVALGADSSGWTVHPYLQDRWTIQLGVFYPDVSTTAELDNSALQWGTQVDFEDDLDLADRKALGSRILFHIPLELGLRLDDRNSVSVYFEHVSNGNLADANEGLDAIGLRYGRRF